MPIAESEAHAAVARPVPVPHRPTVVVFRDHLLGVSESFVLAQAEALEQFEAHYAGCRRIPGPELPAARTLLVNRGGLGGRMAEASYKVLGLAPRFTNAIRRLNPALIHAHFGPDGALILPLARRLHLPLVVSFHGFDATMRDDFAQRSFYLHRRYLRQRPLLQREGRLFIAVSHFVRQRLLAQGFPAERTVVHYVGVDLTRFRPESQVPREPMVLFVGRLAEEKGCEFLIKAMAQVQHRRPEVELVVIGDGPLRGELELLARVWGVRSRFLGTLPQSEVRSWLSRARVFSVPSVTLASGEAEGFGLACVEAQAMGLPVATFATGGVPEAVADGATGLLSPERDYHKLAVDIERLLEDDILWERLSRAGVGRCARLFDLRRQSSALDALYAQVVAS